MAQQFGQMSFQQNQGALTPRRQALQAIEQQMYGNSSGYQGPSTGYGYSRSNYSFNVNPNFSGGL